MKINIIIDVKVNSVKIDIDHENICIWHHYTEQKQIKPLKRSNITQLT